MDWRAAAGVPGALIFEAATQIASGRLLAAGGRVLMIAATGPSVAAASVAAYSAIGHISWPEGFCRRDIGAAGVSEF